MKRALITGIGGQDGSYLSDILLDRGYEVHGLYRHSSVDNLARIAHVRNRVELHVGDVTDHESVCQIMDVVHPHEVYHMADQDSVGDSELIPSYQIDVTLKGTLNVLEAVRWFAEGAKVFVPISATVFSVEHPPQNEESPLDPQSPYAVAKAATWHLCKHYRKTNDTFIACGVMFNHDSPRRGRNYLLQRIARGEKLWGDLETVVDVGFAGDYMQAAWLMLQQDEPDDFCIGTGRQDKISNLLAGWDIERLFNPVGPCLIADPSKAWDKLRWKAEHNAWRTLELIKKGLS